MRKFSAAKPTNVNIGTNLKMKKSNFRTTRVSHISNSISDNDSVTQKVKNSAHLNAFQNLVDTQTEMHHTKSQSKPVQNQSTMEDLLKQTPSNFESVFNGPPSSTQNQDQNTCKQINTFTELLAVFGVVNSPNNMFEFQGQTYKINAD